MYIFSANAIAKKDSEEFKAGESVPFIVYINFKDLFGAEQLCKVYLMQAGFTQIQIKKRKLITQQWMSEQENMEQDAALVAALKDGYFLQAFEAH